MIADVVVFLLAVAAALRGWRRGVLGQAFEFGGGLIGLFAGVAFGPRVAAAVTRGGGVEGALIALAVVLVGLSVGQVIGYLLGQRSGALARRVRLGVVDSALGSLFGVGVTLVSYWLLGSLLVLGPIPSLAHQLRRSEVLRTMNDLGEPPDLLAYVRQYLDASDFPQVFVGFPPATRPVDLPANRFARRALRAAGDSTVRIIVPACGGTQLGSGWIAAPQTVVTNAHVVAGGDDVTVEDLDGSNPGTVVLFDPGLDIAVIKAAGLEGASLPLETAPLERATSGATLGYPGDANGVLKAHPAAVQRLIEEARGLDIYGRDIVSREVYELTAKVRQGDSGGPFVIEGRRVAGVVFAASTSAGDTGYALTGAEVADEVERGISATAPVATGRCTH
ncbi:MAG: MarP family serine protease [Actinomycetota bacterium]